MAEEVPRREIVASSVTYYLPHHAVIREDKVTTKLRVVFDASFYEEGNPSVNYCVITGPNLNPDLMNVLLKFRLHHIAYMADIKKTFLQISLSDRDQDAVRFLWFTGPPTDETDDHLLVLRMMSGVWSFKPILTRNYKETSETIPV